MRYETPGPCPGTDRSSPSPSDSSCQEAPRPVARTPCAPLHAPRIHSHLHHTPTPKPWPKPALRRMPGLRQFTPYRRQYPGTEALQAVLLYLLVTVAKGPCTGHEDPFAHLVAVTAEPEFVFQRIPLHRGSVSAHQRGHQRVAAGPANWAARRPGRRHPCRTRSTPARRSCPRARRSRGSISACPSCGTARSARARKPGLATAPGPPTCRQPSPSCLRMPCSSPLFPVRHRETLPSLAHVMPGGQATSPHVAPSSSWRHR